MFVENVFSVKPAEFCLRGINKLPSKWQEVIQNSCEYTTVEIDSLLNFSWIHYILLKQKLFMIQPNSKHISSQKFKFKDDWKVQHLKCCNKEKKDKEIYSKESM